MRQIINIILSWFKKDDHRNVVTVKEARDLVSVWREDFPDQPKAYTVPLTDVQQVLNQRNVYEVRVYLAAEVSEVIGTNIPAVTKILLVGVDKDGNDMIDASKGQYIYDFTKPCPPKCGSGGLYEWKDQV